LAQVASSARSVIGDSFKDSGLGEKFLVLFGMPFAEGGVGGVSGAVYSASVFESVVTGVVATDSFGFLLQVVRSLRLDLLDAPSSHVFPLTVFAIAAIASPVRFCRILSGGGCVPLEVKLGEEFLFAAGDALAQTGGEFGGDVGHSISLGIREPHSEI
jgi:hypothetical protein